MTKLTAALCGCLVLGVLTTARPASADPPRWADEPLGLEQCIDHALHDAPTEQRLQARLRAAESLLIQARTVPNPVFSYTAQDLGLQTPSGPALLHQQLISYPILIAYLRTQEASVARAAMAQTAAQTDEERRQLRLAVGRAYYDAILSARLAALEEQAVAIAAEFVAQTRRRVQHGDTGSHDVGRAQAEELDARRLAEQASRRRDLDRLALSLLLGTEAPFLVRLREPDVEANPDPVPALEQLLARARSARPDLRAAQAELRRAGEQQRLEARRSIPLAEVQLIGGVRVTATGIGGVLAVGVPLPLFDHNAGPRASAAAQVSAARAALSLVERQLAFDLISAVRELEGARDALLRFARPLVSLRQTTLVGARRLFAEGLTPLLEVIAAQRDLTAAQRALAQAERDAALAAFRLRIGLGDQ